MERNVWSSEDVIADTLKTRPDVKIGVETSNGNGQLVRWRQFVGSYSLPPLPSPVFVVHLGGKRSVHYREGDKWSERASMPGTVTVVPEGVETEWLVNGELDVATLSVGPTSQTLKSLPANLSKFSFSFSDPLSVALTRQIMSELYQPNSLTREDYLRSLVSTLQAHVLHDCATITPTVLPGQSGDMSVMQSIINDLNEYPDRTLKTVELAKMADMSASMFCKTFKAITGTSPKQYAAKVRVDRARELLEHSTLNAGEIADQLGFASQSHFTRVFRNLVGAPPIEYRIACARTGSESA